MMGWFMARKKKPEVVVQPFRLPMPLVKRLDAYAERIGVSRADVVRMLLNEALDQKEVRRGR